MNKQEIFDTVTAHLRTMTEPSINGGTGCAYRGLNDAKCAIGCLIPNEMYSIRMEAKDVRTLIRHQKEENYQLPDFFNADNVELMYVLQNNVHDEYARTTYRAEKREETPISFAEFMEPRLQDIAETFELKYVEPVT